MVLNCFPTAYADSQSPANATEAPDQQSETNSIPPEQPETMIDMSQQLLSRNVVDISRRIDAFFAGDRMMEESIGSYGCLRASVFFNEGGDIDTKGDVCLKIDLPNTKRRWKLIITSDKDDEEERSQVPGTETLESLASEDTGTLAGFRYIANEEILKHTNFDIGIKAHTPVDPFARVRFRRVWAPQPWLFRLTENIYWFKSTGSGVLSRLDTERTLSNDVYARLTTEADYREEEERFRLKQTIGFYKRVGKGKALNLEWQIYATTDNPNTRVEYYVYRARYRVNLWREWFFVEVSPQILYQRENDFEAMAGILFATEAVFGNY